MLHYLRKHKKQKITNQHYTRGSRSRTNKYDYKKTNLRAYDYKEPSVCESTFKLLLFSKIDFD